MKKNIILVSALTAIILFGCVTTRKVTNIQGYKEFINCTDSSCEVCGGLAEFDCYDCFATGSLTCNTCAGTGEVDCSGNPIIGALGLHCVGGEYKPTDPASYGGAVDAQGYALDSSGLRYECTDCYGRGIISCSTCRGSGEVACSTCDGSGRLLHGSWNYYSKCESCGERLENGAETCTNCGLNAIVYECKECGNIDNIQYEVCPECGAGE